MYTYTWKKYLPVIRLLLKKSVTETQVVKLNSMDFDKGTRKYKPSCSFKIELNKGRLSTVNASVPARQLFEILSEDDVARKFIRENKYEVSLNSDFELKITNQNPPQTETTENVPQAAPKDAE